MATCSSNRVCTCNANWDCASHRTGCSTNSPITWWDGDLNAEIITASEINDLRLKIRAEVSRRNGNENYNILLRESSAYGTSTLVTDDQYNNLDQMITDMGVANNQENWDGYVIEDYTTLSEAYTINDGEWDSLISKYNTIRLQCICNTDCACNIDCSCNTNCICNYSDERLKDEIEYC